MNPIQSNTQEGLVVKTSATDLDGKSGYLATVNSSGYGLLLTSAGEQALFVIDDTNVGSGTDVTLRPLSPNRNVRVIAESAITAAAEVTSSANAKAVPASSTNWVFGIAEETAVAGQYCLIRPVGYKKS